MGDEIVTAVLNSAQEFSAGSQSDDLTLLVARARTWQIRQPREAPKLLLRSADLAQVRHHEALFPVLL